jgi:hypothetical protein
MLSYLEIDMTVLYVADPVYGLNLHCHLVLQAFKGWLSEKLNNRTFAGCAAVFRVC